MRGVDFHKVAVRLAMAYNRGTFKDKIQEHIGGALIEWYKAKLAKKLNKPDYIDHWLKEVDYLIRRNLFNVCKNPIRGFKDRKKAIEEVIAHIKSQDDSYRKYAVHIITKDFNLPKFKERIDNKDMKEFWIQVQDVVDAALTL